MSALLAHAKAFDALGDALISSACNLTAGEGRDILGAMGAAHRAAAKALREQARAEASGEDKR